MASGPYTQLESAIDGVLKTEDASPLDSLLQGDPSEVTHIKVSQQFLNKLHKLIMRGLNIKDCKSASLGLTVLHKCGKILTVCDRRGLHGMIAQGLHKKWFEKCRQLWIQGGPKWDEALLNLSEDFFDALMVVHDSCKEGNYNIAESLLCPIGHLAIHPNIYILIQKEAIRRFNQILDKIPVELKKKLKLSVEASDIMVKLAVHILYCGDHDFQTALTEALCRITPPDQRKEVADRLFRMEHVAGAFVQLRDSEFETECRKFLNLVNGMQGDARRVFSYPCLEVYLDKNELLMPADEKLEEFWIDFNTGSQGISFYFSLPDAVVQDEQWETLCITVNEVKSYSVTDDNKRCILRLNLSEVVVVGAVEGSRLTIHFSSSLDIPQAAAKVFGLSKNKTFVGKTSTSVGKSAVKLLMEDSSSQVVLESQLPPGQTEKNTTSSFVPAPSAPAQEVTSDKRKMSESSFFIRCSAAGSERALSTVTPASSGKGKPTLEMVRSNKEFSERRRETAKTCNENTLNGRVTGATIEQNKNHPNPAAVGGEDSLEHGFVPDTQPRGGGSMCKLSVSQILMMPTQKINYFPKSASRSNLPQEEKRQPSAGTLSISDDCSTVPQKQTDTGLPQRPQQRKRGTLRQEAKAQQKNKSDTKEHSKTRRGTCQASKEQKVKRNDKAKGKQQGSPKMDKTPMKHSATTKDPQERLPSTVKGDNGNNLSSKEKKDTELAGSIVSLFSSSYKATVKASDESVPQKGSHHLFNRPVFTMNWLSTGKKAVSASKSLTNVHSKTTADYSRQRKDVFTFKTGESWSTEERCKSFNNISATSSCGIQDSTVESVSAKKAAQPVAKGKRHVKNHLFSDTDTDYVTSEVSWLKESSEKAKPKITKYSRQTAGKALPLPSRSIESTVSPPFSPKPINDIVKSTKQKEAVEKPAASHLKRPRRAAATSRKSYKEPETDGSQSEAEDFTSKHVSVNHKGNAEKEVNRAVKKPSFNPQPTKSHVANCSKPMPKPSLSSKQMKNGKLSLEAQAKRSSKGATSEKPSNTSRKKDHSVHSGLKSLSDVKKWPVTNVPESSKLNKKDLSPADQQMNALRDSWAACQDPPCASPPFIERMRSAERSDPNTGLPCPTLLALQGSLRSASSNPPGPDTPSPVPLLPDLRSAVSSKGKPKASFIYSMEKNHNFSMSQCIQSVSSPLSLTFACPNAAADPPPPSPLLSMPLLTSALNDTHHPSVPLPPQPPTPGHASSSSSHYVFSEVSLVSPASPCTSSIQSELEFTRAAARAIQKEGSTPVEEELMSSENFTSGPALKRHSHFEEKKEKKRSRIQVQSSFRMKPRKLFTSFTEVPAQSPVSHLTSSNSVCCATWDPEEGDVDMEEGMELPTPVNPSGICQKFSSELRKKFENRHMMLEVHNNQSLTAMQQHLTSLHTQLSKCRTGRDGKVLEVLLGEMDKLDQDETLLKTMEKDLTIYWKRQSVAFSSYQEQEKKRTETLKKALQGNVRLSLDCEENLFTSQMCLMRRDMRTVQERLLSQMHEGEIQTVKRGLHSLFFP